MKTFNVPYFYNRFCYYFKSTCFIFDKVIKLFTLSCLHLELVFDPINVRKHDLTYTILFAFKKKYFY